MSRKRTTVITLLIICGLLAVTAIECYRYEQVVFEEWGERLVPPSGVVSFNLPNLIRDDTVHVRFKPSLAVDFYIFSLEYWETHKENFSTEFSLIREDYYFEEFRCEITKDDSYVMLGKNTFSTPQDLRIYYEVIRHPYRYFFLPLFVAGIGVFVASIPIQLLHKEPPFSCPYCGEKENFGWNPKTKRKFCGNCKRRL